MEKSTASQRIAQVTEDPARFAPLADTIRGWLGHSFEFYSDGAGVWSTVWDAAWGPGLDRLIDANPRACWPGV